MAAPTFETVHVFTESPIGGNPLAVVFGAEHLEAREMQQIAADFGFSETTFVLPPADAAHTARVRIFTPSAELPFAGHPNVGTAVVVAGRQPGGLGLGKSLCFEELSGEVRVDLEADAGGPVAFVTAPEPWRVLGAPLPAAACAACLGLSGGDLCVERHAPLVATAGLPFVLVELVSLEALARSRGTPAAFAAPALAGAPPKILAYVWTGAPFGGAIRCRMHRGDGTEDAGTGSANCALIGLLASLLPAEPAAASSLRCRVEQGVEMGSPCTIFAEAACAGAADGTAARPVGQVRVGGRCASVARGELPAYGRGESAQASVLNAPPATMSAAAAERMAELGEYPSSSDDEAGDRRPANGAEVSWSASGGTRDGSFRRRLHERVAGLSVGDEVGPGRKAASSSFVSSFVSPATRSRKATGAPGEGDAGDTPGVKHFKPAGTSGLGGGRPRLSALDALAGQK